MGIAQRAVGVALGRGEDVDDAVGVADEVARVDLDSLKVTGRLSVGREPRGLALSPDGKSVALSTNNDKGGARVVILSLN